MAGISWADEARLLRQAEADRTRLYRHGIEYVATYGSDDSYVHAIESLTRIAEKLARAEKKRQHGFCGCDECKEEA